MEKWNLFVVAADEPIKETFTRAKTFAEAEEIAKKLYDEYNNGHYCDLCVFCTPHKALYHRYSDFHPDDDFPVFLKDCFGETYWRRMKVGDLCLIGLVYDPGFIDEIRKEDEESKPRHISDLSKDELEKLFGQICFGSFYLSDYRNDFNVDEEEVYAKAEGYSDGLFDEYGDDWYEHLNAADFAEYCVG